MTSADGRSSSRRIPVLGSAAGGLRFEPLLAAEDVEGLDEPFLPLSDSGRFSRVLRARIALGSDATVRDLALKIPRNAYRPFGAGAATPFLTNVEIDELWEREYRNLLLTDGKEVVSMLDLGPDLRRTLPIAFCKKTRKYFHPLCARCLGFLEDCRDNVLLRDFGLPTYETSAQRYLSCPSCSTAEAALFYAYGPHEEEHPKGNVEIRRRQELYRDMGTIARSDYSEEERARLQAVFPCFGNRDACFPKGAEGEERHIVPVLYYEGTILPLDLLQLHYDELADLLGGAPWAAVKQTALERGGARDRILNGLDPILAAPFQFVYQQNQTGLLAVEILRLKLTAFTEVCRAVRSFHERVRQPHLSLEPSSIMATLSSSSPDLPARWNFRTRLLDPASPHRFRPLVELAEIFGDVFVPSPDVEKTYAAPLVRQGALAQEEQMRVTVRNVARTERGAWLEVDAISSKVRLQDYRVGDIVHIVPTTSIPWLEGADLWGTILEALERGFRINAFAPGMSADAKPPVTVDGAVSFHRRFGIPCDLYSLGMILLRTILVNDQQDIFAVEDAVHKVLTKLQVALEGTEHPGRAYITGRLGWELDGEKAVFHKRGVTYTATDRDARPNAIPDPIWSDLLLLAFRLVSAVPNFSFCDDHGDYDAANPAGKMDEVLGELDLINRRLQIELFGAPDRNTEIATLCRALQEQITGEGLSLGEESSGMDEAQFVQ